MAMRRAISGSVATTQALNGQRRNFTVILPLKWYTPTPEIMPSPKRTDRTEKEIQEWVQLMEQGKGTNQFSKLGSVEFMDSAEYNRLSQPRLNQTKEFEYQREARLNATDSFHKVAKAKVEAAFASKARVYSNGDMMEIINDAANAGADELDKKIQLTQRLVDFAWENPQFLCAEPKLRKTVAERLPVPSEMGYTPLAELRRTVQDWLPMSAKQIVAPDYQACAAFDPELRDELLKIVDTEAEAAKKGVDSEESWTAEEKKSAKGAIDEAAQLGKKALNPTSHITAESIAAEKNVQNLQRFAEEVSAYNGDERLMLILQQWGKLTEDLNAQKFAASALE